MRASQDVFHGPKWNDIGEKVLNVVTKICFDVIIKASIGDDSLKTPPCKEKLVTCIAPAMDSEFSIGFSSSHWLGHYFVPLTPMENFLGFVLGIIVLLTVIPLADSDRFLSRMSLCIWDVFLCIFRQGRECWSILM